MLRMTLNHTFMRWRGMSMAGSTVTISNCESVMTLECSFQSISQNFLQNFMPCSWNSACRSFNLGECTFQWVSHACQLLCKQQWKQLYSMGQEILYKYSWNHNTVWCTALELTKGWITMLVMWQFHHASLPSFTILTNPDHSRLHPPTPDPDLNICGLRQLFCLVPHPRHVCQLLLLVPSHHLCRYL